MDKKLKCTAIVLAGGRGSRMKSDIPKQYLPLDGKPVLYYSLRCFEESDRITDIVLVTDPTEAEYCRNEIIQKYGIRKVSSVVGGGKERYNSVMSGLAVCKAADYVFVHDSARPFLTIDMIEEGFQKALQTKACIAAVPAKDTIKILDQDRSVAETPDRSKLYIVQTPQIFAFELLKDAYKKAEDAGMEGITDDATVIERFTDHKVYIYKGSYDNIKITTPEDLPLAEQIVLKFKKTKKNKK